MVIEPGTQDEAEAVVEGLNRFNLSMEAPKGPTQQRLEWIAKTDRGIMMGGIFGVIGYWLGLEISILWVDEPFRRQGVGAALLQKMESEAKKRGATVAMVDTFDFQAEGFYRKSGYLEVGRISDFPKGRSKIYFHKSL